MLESIIDKDGAKNGAVALPDKVAQEGGSNSKFLVFRRPSGSPFQRDPNQLTDSIEDAA
jgi:hypothetical protein